MHAFDAVTRAGRCARVAMSSRKAKRLPKLLSCQVFPLQYFLNYDDDDASSSARAAEA